jgi:heme A synthase
LDQKEDMGVHRYAVAVALATFVLLIFGGLVSTTESGLACPDWPLCNGEFIPKMIDGKEYEHTHRLVASFVGAMTFGLCALLVKYRRRDRLLVTLGAVAAVLVTIQALLGALTVKLKLPWWVSSAHLATAMAFFCLTVSIAFLTYQRRPGVTAQPAAVVPGGRLMLVVVALTYLQMVAGGLMRHLRGGMACGFDFPLCLGSVWPADGHLGVQVHMIHRVLGVIVGAVVIALFVIMWRRGAQRALKISSAAAALLVLVQIGLGIMTVLLSRELITMTVHSTVGAALLGVVVSIFWIGRPLPLAGRPIENPLPLPSGDGLETA